MLCCVHFYFHGFELTRLISHSHSYTIFGTVHPGCLPHERHNCDAGLHCPKHCEGGGGSGGGGGGGGEIYLLKLLF